MTIDERDSQTAMMQKVIMIPDQYIDHIDSRFPIAAFSIRKNHRWLGATSS